MGTGQVKKKHDDPMLVLVLWELAMKYRVYNSDREYLWTWEALMNFTVPLWQEDRTKEKKDHGQV